MNKQDVGHYQALPRVEWYHSLSSGLHYYVQYTVETRNKLFIVNSSIQSLVTQENSRVRGRDPSDLICIVALFNTRPRLTIIH